MPDLIMEGRKSGKMEVDESIWRNMLETAVSTGEFSRHQLRNINAWLQYDWSTIVNSKVCIIILWSSEEIQANPTLIIEKRSFRKNRMQVGQKEPQIAFDMRKRC